MPTLLNLLLNHEPDIQHIILEKWGFPRGNDVDKKELSKIIEIILEKGTLQEMVQTLPEDAKKCFSTLVDAGGKLTWTQLSRDFGDMRVMGAAKRERIHPERQPINAVEILWYSGLIGRAFFDAKPEPNEFAYIPDDILALFSSTKARNKDLFGKALAEDAKFKVVKTQDFIVDDICTILAGLRMGKAIDQIKPMRSPFSIETLLHLAAPLQLWDAHNQVHPERVQAHLIQDRTLAHHELLQAWMKNITLSEILLMPDLTFEGDLNLNPVHTRERLVSFFREIPLEAWWDITALIEDVKRREPEFLRVAGDMDSWFIKNKKSGQILHGAEHWEDVEGGFLEFFIATVLYGLGLCDLAQDRQSGKTIALRWTAARVFLDAEPGQTQDHKPAPFYSLPQANLSIHASFSRAVRYQIARFCEWKGMRRGEYQYQITPASLEEAQKQGLQGKQLIALLQKHLTKKPETGLFAALQRFSNKNEHAQISAQYILEISDPKIMKKVLASDLQKYILDQLNSTTLLIDKKGIEHFHAKLTELGYLCQVRREV